MKVVRHFSILVVAVFSCYLVVTPANAKTVTIKLGTLAPDGSSWHVLLKQMAERWSQVSEGKVKLKIFPGGVAGKYFHEFFENSNREIFKRRIFRLMNQRELISGVEVCLMHRGGDKVFVEINGVPFYDSKGNLLGYRGVNRDITSRKRAENALRESEEKFRSIFAESPIGIELYDAEGRLIGRIGMRHSLLPSGENECDNADPVMPDCDRDDANGSWRPADQRPFSSSLNRRGPVWPESRAR